MPDPELSLIVLRCAEVELTRGFYEAVGLRFVTEQHGNGPVHVATTLPSGLVLELYPAAATRPR